MQMRNDGCGSNTPKGFRIKEMKKYIHPRFLRTCSKEQLDKYAEGDVEGVYEEINRRKFKRINKGK